MCSKALGGSGSVEEIYDKVVELEKLPEDVLVQLHDPEKSNESEVAYRLAWVRTYLKKYGYLENSTRGVWSLTAKAKQTELVDPQVVVRTVRALDKKVEPEKDDGPLPQPEFRKKKSGRRSYTRSSHKSSLPQGSRGLSSACSASRDSLRSR